MVRLLLFLVLLALAATALHALSGSAAPKGVLIIGHGVLGRLIARLVTALADRPPVVWEHNPNRVAGAAGYSVISPETDPAAIIDRSAM